MEIGIMIKLPNDGHEEFYGTGDGVRELNAVYWGIKGGDWSLSKYDSLEETILRIKENLPHLDKERNDLLTAGVIVDYEHHEVTTIKHDPINQGKEPSITVSVSDWRDVIEDLLESTLGVATLNDAYDQLATFKAYRLIG
jgi:hypothetical protein